MIAAKNIKYGGKKARKGAILQLMSMATKTAAAGRR
jgi:hypothetical protein